MLSFASRTQQTLNEEKSLNKHLDHIEDLMILNGKDGLDLSIAFLKDIVESLRTGQTSMGVSAKWDGKPAVVCGVNPENGKFFVSTKSAFSKTVKAYHTEDEIRKGIEIKDLADKLVECLKYLPKLGIKGVLQGDLMFVANSKRTLKVGKDDSVGFQPNTILYTAPLRSEVGRQINAAKLGIVFHTAYSGGTMSSLSATTFNFDSSKLKKTADVWFTDPNVYDLTPALLKPNESDPMLRDISECESLAKKVSPFLGTLLAQADLVEMLMPYINGTINGGLAQFTASGFSLYVKTRFEKDINKLKTEKGKQAKTDTMNKALNFIDAYDKQFTNLFALHNMIANVKEMILTKLHSISQFGHFFVDDEGIRPTDPEGFVIARSGRVVKLVNRLRFSRQNRKVNQ
jgi:hypothetical protein